MDKLTEGYVTFGIKTEINMFYYNMLDRDNEWICVFNLFQVVVPH